MFDPTTVLQTFIEKIKTIRFLQRLFSWKKVQSQLVDAAASLSNLITELENLRIIKSDLNQELLNCRKDVQLLHTEKARLQEAEKSNAAILAQKENSIADFNKKLTTADANIRHLEKQVEDLKTDLLLLKQQHENLQQELQRTTEENIKLEQEEEGRKQEHAKAINTFEKWRTEIHADRNREIEEKQQAEIERIKNLRQTWLDHENTVKAKMKALCQKLTIEYADSVPFRGSPDNAIKLCNEFIVFDAKSPGSDDLNNFPFYLKDQAEKAKKYAKQEAVKKDVFFVIPSDTLELVRQTVFSLGDFDVYIVSIDVLEPLLLCLQKIETYEFAEQLTPEERENICRIIGRFTHLTKRRIQIDSFFAKQFMEMVLKCDSDLPEEIKNEVAAFEKAEKLNPPGDRRTKTIDNKQLQHDVNQLSLEIESKGVVTDDLSEELNRVRLYRE